MKSLVLVSSLLDDGTGKLFGVVLLDGLLLNGLGLKINIRSAESVRRIMFTLKFI